MRAIHLATVVLEGLVAVSLLGCAATPATTPSGAGSPAATALGGPPSSAPSGPAASLSTPSTSEALPAPTLTDPAAIGAALWDPQQVPVGVVSMLAALGVAIDADDGSTLRAGSGTALADLHLRESEVRGLIEMGQADAAAIAAHQAPFTLADLSRPLAALMPGMTPDQIVAAYVDAYRRSPGDLVRESLAGHAFVATGAFTRVHLWLLLVDGVLGRKPGATAATHAATVRFVAAANGPVAQIGLPQIPSGIPGLDARDYAILLVHLPLAGYQVPITLSIAPAAAHEGHGGPGPTVAIEARHSTPPVPLVSVVDGHVLLAPSHPGLDGVPIIFESADQAVLDAHGTLQGTLGAPVLTDALGVSRVTYQVQQEAANGAGTVETAAASINAVIDLRALVLSQYVVAPEILPLIWGTRIVPGVLSLEWHENQPTPGPGGSYTVTLTGPKTGAGTYVGSTNVICAAPTINGRLYWSAIGLVLSGVGGSLTDFNLQQDPDGRDTVMATAGGMDTGSWFAASNIAGDTAKVVGDGEPGVQAHVSGEGSFTDSEGRVFTIHVAAECSDTSY